MFIASELIKHGVVMRRTTETRDATTTFHSKGIWLGNYENDFNECENEKVNSENRNLIATSIGSSNFNERGFGVDREGGGYLVFSNSEAGKRAKQRYLEEFDEMANKSRILESQGGGGGGVIKMLIFKVLGGKYYL